MEEILTEETEEDKEQDVKKRKPLFKIVTE